MKLEVTSRFAQDLAARALTPEEAEQFVEVLDLLRSGSELPAFYKEHALAKPGPWQGYLECHLGDDWLLIYRRRPGRVTVFRAGTHRDLFKRRR